MGLREGRTTLVPVFPEPDPDSRLKELFLLHTATYVPKSPRLFDVLKEQREGG